MVGLGVLLLSRFYIVSQLVLQSDMGPWAAFKFVTNFLPHYISLMVPAALYWAIYETVRRLTFNRELEAVFSLGMNPVVFFLPFFVLGILATAYSLLLLGWVEPAARYEYRSTLFAIENRLALFQVKENTFTTLNGKTILLEHINHSQNNFGRIFLFGPHEESVLAVTAQSGELTIDEGDVTLSLKNGTWLQTTDDDEKRVIENSNFEDLDMKVASLSTQFRAIGGDEQEFTLLELFKAFNGPPIGTAANEMTTEFCRKLATIFTGLFLPLLAIAMGSLWRNKHSLTQGLFAIAWPILYFQSLIVGEVLSREDIVSPFLFYGVSYFFMFAASLWVFHFATSGTSRLSWWSRRKLGALGKN